MTIVILKFFMRLCYISYLSKIFKNPEWDGRITLQTLSIQWVVCHMQLLFDRCTFAYYCYNEILTTTSLNSSLFCKYIQQNILSSLYQSAVYSSLALEVRLYSPERSPTQNYFCSRQQNLEPLGPKLKPPHTTKGQAKFGYF